jgi:hypothetical protein
VVIVLKSSNKRYQFAANSLFAQSGDVQPGQIVGETEFPYTPCGLVAVIRFKQGANFLKSFYHEKLRIYRQFA